MPAPRSCTGNLPRDPRPVRRRTAPLPDSLCKPKRFPIRRYFSICAAMLPTNFESPAWAECRPSALVEPMSARWISMPLVRRFGPIRTRRATRLQTRLLILLNMHLERSMSNPTVLFRCRKTVVTFHLKNERSRRTVNGIPRKSVICTFKPKPVFRVCHDILVELQHRKD